MVQRYAIIVQLVYPLPHPRFSPKSSDLLENTVFSENKEGENCTRVSKLLIANKMSNLVSTVECGECELFAKSSDITENKADVS